MFVVNATNKPDTPRVVGQHPRGSVLFFKAGGGMVLRQGRYDRMTDDLFKLTGQKPISMHDFVKLHAAEFTRPEIKA